jgi:hypothetical protein
MPVPAKPDKPFLEKPTCSAISDLIPPTTSFPNNQWEIILGAHTFFPNAIRLSHAALLLSSVDWHVGTKSTGRVLP